MRYVSIAIASIVLIIVGIFGYRIISNQIKSLDNKPSSVEQIKLSELKNTGSKLRLSITGPIVAEENHRTLVFEVGQGTRSVKLLKGYIQTLEKEQQLANNYNAYEAFAGALYNSGYMLERTNIKNTNYTNQCPNGNVYRAELVDAENKIKKSLWRVSCDAKAGTMSGNPNIILGLFKKQFPDYNVFASDISID